MCGDRCQQSNSPSVKQACKIFKIFFSKEWQDDQIVKIGLLNGSDICRKPCSRFQYYNGIGIVLRLALNSSRLESNVGR